MSQKNISILSLFFSRHDFQNCFLRVQKDVLRKKICWRSLICFFFQFGTTKEKSWVNCQHVFGRIVKTAIYLPIGSFQGEILFRKKILPAFHPRVLSRKMSDLWHFFRQIVKAAIHISRGEIRERKFPWQKKFFIFFGNWAEYCQIYVKKFRAGISKLHSMFWKWSVDETLVFSNWLIFFLKNLVILSEKCWRNFFYEDNFFSFSVSEQ